jgi:hypothetical protein
MGEKGNGKPHVVAGEALSRSALNRLDWVTCDTVSPERLMVGQWQLFAAGRNAGEDPFSVARLSSQPWWTCLIDTIQHNGVLTFDCLGSASLPSSFATHTPWYSGRAFFLDYVLSMHTIPAVSPGAAARSHTFDRLWFCEFRIIISQLASECKGYLKIGLVGISLLQEKRTVSTPSEMTTLVWRPRAVRDVECARSTKSRFTDNPRTINPLRPSRSYRILSTSSSASRSTAGT